MNPHSPTRSWLEAVIDDNGYDSDPDEGDSGSMELNRPEGTYYVEVTLEESNE